MGLNGRGRPRKKRGGVQIEGLAELWHLWGQGCLRGMCPLIEMERKKNQSLHSFLPETPTQTSQSQAPCLCKNKGRGTTCVHLYCLTFLSFLFFLLPLSFPLSIPFFFCSLFFTFPPPLLLLLFGAPLVTGGGAPKPPGTLLRK